MKKIYLLKSYKNYGSNEIITVSNDIASDLINQGVARECGSRDFLIKPEFGVSKAIDTSKLNKGRQIVERK